MDLIEALNGIMREGEGIDFTLNRADADTVEVLIIPRMGDEPEGLSEAAQQARAALATPLRVKDNVANIEAGLADKLAGYGEARQDLGSTYDHLLAQMKEADKGAKNAAKSGQSTQAQGGSDQGADQAPKGADGGEASEAEATEAAASGNPDSLL